MVTLSVILLAGAWYPFTVNIDNIPYASSESRDISLALKDYITEKDIVITGEYDAPYWYYFDYYHIPQSAIRNVKTRPFKNAYIIDNPKETLDMIINNNNYINRVMIGNLQKVVLQTAHSTIYRMPASVSAQAKSFPQVDLSYWR